MRSHESFDVLVVGARCAGAATAMLMARRGLKVLAIDRGGYGTDTLSTHALMRGGVFQLHRWGLLPRIVEMGTPAVRSTTFHYGDEVVDVPIKPSHGVDALYAPRRTVLDSVLVDAAQEAGAEVRHSWTLADLIRRPDGRVAGAVVVDPEGCRVEIAAELVVGADGIGSTVARLARAPTLRTSQHATAALYGYWSGIDADGYRWHYREGAGAGTIPTNAGQHCLFASIPPERFRRGDRNDLTALYRHIVAESWPELASMLAGARLEGRVWAFAGRKGFLRQPWGPGWALVGDAGYFKDPLTAHGITDALRDAELLAEAAARGTPAAFREYAEVRDELSLPLFRVTDAIASCDWDLDMLKSLHQALNKAMKREVDWMAERTVTAGAC
ncbi:NAD(P)/FAD-dependent oxidoreductase [Azospirillum soli]|uniref:NAD(P)/FAD-dependent oxidoreductase n=1 Tax=Azospirillum soli TaxID=1304799 RepID=UPI001AE9C3A3|nr:NAD(P)/FAD-dependent oxidoreductase [Azospirillum soli]MBP2314564.1 flavin-dependent dehydrogenase [Azospirillum soli]